MTPEQIHALGDEFLRLGGRFVLTILAFWLAIEVVRALKAYWSRPK